MLGRKDYPKEELDQAKTAIERQLQAYRQLADTVSNKSDPGVTAALAALEPVLSTTWFSPWIGTSCIACAWSPARTATR
jgi:hypothetical protein